MPLTYRTVGPRQMSNGKLELKGKTDSEFIAVNNETLVNVLRQLASVVTQAGDIFSDVASLTEQVGKRVHSVKLRLDKLETKADAFEPRLVPVPEGTLDDISKTCHPHLHQIHGDNSETVLSRNLLHQSTRPRFLIKLIENASKHEPTFPPRSPLLDCRRSLERQISTESRRPASFAALRDWKLDDYMDEKISTLNRKKPSAEALSRALASPFPSQVVQVDVTGAGFDRMKANRRSLVVHTKKIRNKKRRNTICGSMPNKECGIQTSFTSVASPGGTTGDEDDRGSHGEHSAATGHHHRGDASESKKYGIDSGHWSSSCTSSAQGVPGVVGGSSCSAPSPWDPNSLSTSSDFLFDEEDRCLTPQLENFTDGLVSDSDSVDTDGYFTSFRSDCGFPRLGKKSTSTKELENGSDLTTSTITASKENEMGSLTSSGGIFDTTLSTEGSDGGTTPVIIARSASTAGTGIGTVSTGNFMMNGSSTQTSANSTVIGNTSQENEYELFGKGSTSTTASSCGTVVLRSKPEPPARTSSSAVVPNAVETDTGDKDNTPNCGSSCTNDDTGLEERVKRKSLIERVPSMVVVTPSPSCSSGSPPPLKDPGNVLQLMDRNSSSAAEDSQSESGRLTPKAEDLFTTNESECGTLSDTDSDRRAEVRLSDIAMKKRSTGSSSTSSTGTASTSNSTLTLTSCALSAGPGLPQPDVIPAEAVVQQLQIIRTNKGTPRLDANKEYYSLDTVLLGSFEEELQNKKSMDSLSSEDASSATTTSTSTSNSPTKKGQIGQENASSITSSATAAASGLSTSGKVRGARVVLDANGDIIFSSETLRRKRKQKVSFDPGSAVRSPDYDSNSTYARVRESVYDRIKKDPGEQEKLYECIEEIRRHNLKPRDPFLEMPEKSGKEGERCTSADSSTMSSYSPSKSPNGVLETDLDSAIPPVMPDLKNLPKIKDRLKRNESYRIANTDDLPNNSSDSPSPVGGRSTPPGKKPGRRSPLSPLHLNRNGLNSLAKRMSLTSSPFTSSSTIPLNGRIPPAAPSPTPLHLNKKRDIPEEDPTFIQQVFSMNQTANSQLNSSNISNGGNHQHSLLRSPHDNSNKLTPSKFSLSAEDRPSFLRRDSPPTMDEIAKEIYRFRKKFNIQPNAASTTLTRSVSTTPTRNGNPNGGIFLGGGSLRRHPQHPNHNLPVSPSPSAYSNRSMPRSSSSIGNYSTTNYSTSPAIPMGNSTLPRNGSVSSSPTSKSTIPEGFPTLSMLKPVRPPPPAGYPMPVPPLQNPPHFNPVTHSTPSPVKRPASITSPPSPIYYPNYSWASTPTPKCSTPIGRNPTGTLERSPPSAPPNRMVPPVPPVRNFAASRKIYPMVSNGFSSGSSTPTSVHSLNSSRSPYNPYQSVPITPPKPITQDPTAQFKTNNYNYNNNNSNTVVNGGPSNFRKSINLLPSLPFRRNSVAIAESTSPFSPGLRPRTSLGEFKRLLQQTQKKRSSISAVEVLKPKGLETTL